MARAGSSASNGSGHYAIAFSTAPQLRIRAFDKSLTRQSEVLTNDAMSPANDVKQQVGQIKPGSLIAIRFTDGSEARGYVTQVDADGFSFRIGDSTSGDQRRTTFDAVKSVKPVESTHRVAWITTGVVIGAVVIALIVYLIERHNEGG